MLISLIERLEMLEKSDFVQNFRHTVLILSQLFVEGFNCFVLLSGNAFLKQVDIHLKQLANVVQTMCFGVVWDADMT